MSLETNKYVNLIEHKKNNQQRGNAARVRLTDCDIRFLWSGGEGLSHKSLSHSQFSCAIDTRLHGIIFDYIGLSMSPVIFAPILRSYLRALADNLWSLLECLRQRSKLIDERLMAFVSSLFDRECH